MAESLTISRQAPAIKSMNYALLREQGIARLQALAGNLWTDFNIHDPGVTILEALAYAITDLGYRSSYKMQDILALAPGDTSDIRNFFSAYEILTNRALTPNDYRKLMMDVEITDAETGIKAGVKNAWLLKAPMQEVPFYIHPSANALSYVPDPLIPNQASIKLRGLYNVLLEFDSNDRFGDMNESYISGVMKVVDDGSISDNRLLFKNIIIDVDLPRWDTPGIDWNDQLSIRAKINKKITLDFSDYPDNYIFNYTVNNSNGSITFVTMANPPYSTSGEDTDRDGVITTLAEAFSPVNLTLLEVQINDFLFDTDTGLIAEYQRKVKIVQKLLDEVYKTIMANRNLCEDFISFKTVRIEDIAMCGEIQVETEADIEEVLASIYYKIGEFLSPTIYFRTIEELMAKGLTSDQIFEGPRLKHGFIDDKELATASIRETIHVSDLYQIIMDVPGVVAVRNLQIANLPEDAADNIITQSVKWCLNLAFDKSYRPRISTEHSNITFFKDVLPYEAKEVEVLERLAELRRTDRDQRLTNPVLDLPVPQGEFKEIENYTSVQDEFPLVYGIGEVGLPDSASALRKAQAHQLKGFLMFFDQLLTDYLAQLSHVKDLFSLNGDRDTNGNLIINRTYFTQTLINVVPNVADLYVDQPNHAANLNAMAEDTALFESRRNRFLDHLMARFGETFSDYALLAYTIDGPKAPEELIDDKLRFLNSYADISYGRAGAFDYTDTCKLWSIDNLSGLEKRAALLAGIDPVDPSDLLTPESIDIIGSGSFTFNVIDSGSNILMNSVNTYASLDEILIAAEYTVNSGSFESNYYYFDAADLNTPIDPLNPPAGATSIRYKLYCGNEPLAISATTFTDITAALAIALAQTEIAGTTIPTLFADYEAQPSYNRKSLECGLTDNLRVDIYIEEATVDCPLKAKVDFTILDDGGEDWVVYTTIVPSKTGETADQLEQRIESIAHDILLEFLIDAVNPANYRLEIISGDYVFSAFNKCAETVASSVETEFNDALAAFFSSTPVLIYDQAGVLVPGSYSTTGAATVDLVTRELIDVTVVPILPLGFTTGKIAKAFTQSVISIDETRRTFRVLADLRGFVYAGDVISLSLFDGVTNYPGNYTVTGVHVINHLTFETEVTVTEIYPVIAFVSGTLSHTASLPVVGSTHDTIFNRSYLVLRANVGQLAIDDFVYFLKTKFLSNEGFHLIEHILLRPHTPTVKTFETADDKTLDSALTVQGDLYYAKKLNIIGIDTTNKIFTVGGNITSELSFGRVILVAGSGTNNGTYTVLTVGLAGSDTEITVVENVSDPTIAGTVAYTRQLPIDSIDPTVTPNPATITIASIDLSAEINPGDVIIVNGSENGRNDNRYLVATVDAVSAAPDTIISISKLEVEYKDKFLAVSQLVECEDCRYEDPYSFVVSIVMPYWRGRFSNMAFREFFERTLRMEAPAHVMLNICWVSCSQMEDFEKAYRAWLYFHATKQRNVLQHTIAQNNLVDILLKLRTVYPKGTLHDCEAGDQTSGSIVLNQSVLGSI